METGQQQYIEITYTIPTQEEKKKSKTMFIRGEGTDIVESVNILLNERCASSEDVSSDIIAIASSREYELIRHKSDYVNEPLIISIRNEISNSKSHPNTWEDCVQYGKKTAKERNLNEYNLELLICKLVNTFVLSNAYR